MGNSETSVSITYRFFSNRVVQQSFKVAAMLSPFWTQPTSGLILVPVVFRSKKVLIQLNLYAWNCFEHPDYTQNLCSEFGTGGNYMDHGSRCR